jgi:hypothetical protein
MNRYSFRIACIIFLVIGLAGPAAAQGRGCSNDTLKGAWGYTETGSVILPASLGGTVVTAAAVGRYDFDKAGKFEGGQYSSANGVVGPDTKQGTYTINRDCTGTLTLTAFREDANGNKVPQRLSVWAFIIDDNRQEMRAIMLSMKHLGFNVDLLPIMTMTASKGIPGRDHDK